MTEKYPQWELEEEERDEFNTWFWTGRKNRCDITANELIAFPIQQRIEKLTEPSDDYPNDRLSLFASICQEKPEFALETMKVLVEQSNWDASVWHSAIMALSDANAPQYWLETAKLIVQLPNGFFATEAWVISRWLNKTIGAIAANSVEEAYFWQIFDLLVTHAQPVEAKEDVIFGAINNPIGILTEAFISRFSVREYKAKEKISEDNLLSRLNKLVSAEESPFILARVILVSRLHYFYAIDPGWTRNNLIPLLDWDLSGEADALWQGWLWNPRVSVDLGLDIKEHLLKTLLLHSSELGKKTEMLYQLFASLCFEYKTLYSIEEQQKILNAIGQQGLKIIARSIKLSFGENTQQNDQYWKNRIKPFFINAWPKESQLLSPEISRFFADMSLDLDEEFEDAVRCIKSILTHCEIGSLLRKLKKSQHIEKHPRTAFDLLATVFDPDNERFIHINDFKEIIDSLVSNDPEIKNDLRYQAIEQYLKRNSSY
ncbi:MAG: hypothetical protein IPN42_11770 [Methylococcaceae bacterium]|nr:hypothetical protein [Methylococcaceae bacterium]